MKNEHPMDPPLPLSDSPSSLSLSLSTHHQRPSPPNPSGSMDSTTSSNHSISNSNIYYPQQQGMYPPPLPTSSFRGGGQDEGGGVGGGRFFPPPNPSGSFNFAYNGGGGGGGNSIHGMGVMPAPSDMNGGSSYQLTPSHPLNSSSIPYHPLASTSSQMPYHPPASSSSADSISTPAGGGKKRKASNETTSNSNGTPSSATSKGKGKKTKKGSAGVEDGDSISPTKEEEDEEAKRTKTSRACDRCRGKKTRCDILPNTDPPLCQHCRNAKLDCTFFLPITETRFKKKRQQEEAAKAAAEGKPYEPPKPTTFPPASTTKPSSSSQPQYPSYPTHPHQLDVKPSPSSATIPQRQMSGSSLVGGGGSLSPAGGSGSSERMQERLNARVQGPTSISFLLHSTATIPPHTFDNYDLRHHTAFEISSTGDGLIKVYHPPRSSDPNSPSFNIPSGIESRLAPDIIERLVNSYFQNVAPLFPVVSRVEFLKEGKDSPLLLYAICGVAATRRDVPREVFNSLRTTINGIIKHNDVLSDTSLVNIQSLLILSQVGDLHSQPLTAATSAAANRLGVAIRMAQDLGLHRDEITRTDDLSEFEQMEERAFLELKRRIWSACVIMDRWYAASMGMPQIIDLLDCDVLLPDPDEVPLPDRMNEPGARSSPYLYFCEMLKLSILLGRITKTVYGPTGLKHASDHQLNSLLIDMRSWKAALPGPLQFSGPTTSTYQAGILHIYYTALLFLFFRVFMRISYSLPSHLQFSLDVLTWTELVEDSRQAIEWLDRNDHALDTMFLVSYATTSVALVQYHTWARRKDPKALNSMKQLRDIGRRWENTVQPDHMSIRRRTMEVMSLLFDAAKHIHASSPPLSPNLSTRLNPTPGVVNNRPSLSHLITWNRDPSRPGGGVFLADEAVGRGLAEEGLQPGVVLGIPRSSGVRSTADGSGGGMGASFNVNPIIGGPAVEGPGGMMIAGGAPIGGSMDEMMAFQQQQQQHQQQEFGYAPGGGGGGMVMGMDPSQPQHQQLQQQQQVEPGYLENLPGAFYDFNSWDTFFSRFPISQEVASPQSMTNNVLPGASIVDYQQQPQQQQMGNGNGGGAFDASG